jgi:phenylacetate-CoA ligase
MYNVSVIVPCYNEAGNVDELTSRLLKVFGSKDFQGQVVLVNDGSSDETGQMIDALARQHEPVKAVHHPENRGMEAGWRTGLQNSDGELVCLIDADLQYVPEDVWRLYREYRHSGADLVQGFRSAIGRLRDGRYVLSKGLNIMLNGLFSMNQRDNKSGFIICRREVLAEILTHRFNYHYFQSFITVAAHSRGYSIREVETLFNERLVGQSFLGHFPWKVVARTLTDLSKAYTEYRLISRGTSVLKRFLRDHNPTRTEETLPGWRRPLFNFYTRTMPLHHWTITRQSAHYYEQMKKTQWLSPSDIRKLQEQRLRKLVRHAYAHVAYYREAFKKAGLKPKDIRTIEDLQKLPLLSKDDVRQHLYFDLLADNHKKSEIQKITTSGSTGEPFVCYVDRTQLEMRWAATQRSLEWTGYRFGDKQARLWHQTVGMTSQQERKERLAAQFNRRLFIPAFELNDESLDRFMKMLAEYEPVLIDGYAESLNFLAHYLKHKGLPPMSPRAVMSSAQTLPRQSREIIESQFGCKVFDKYGSREFSGVAYECDAHDGHHVVAENYIIELLREGRPAKPGEVGEVVITDLNNYCMPFLRYRVGDLAVAMDNSASCSCGRGLPRIGDIQGRTQAVIQGGNGNYLPGTFFAHLLKDFDHVIRHFQVVQERERAVKLRIVKGPRYQQSSFAEVMDLLYHHLGHNTQIELEHVEEIPLGPTGKRSHSISTLGNDFQSLGSD